MKKQTCNLIRCGTRQILWWLLTQAVTNPVALCSYCLGYMVLDHIFQFCFSAEFKDTKLNSESSNNPPKKPQGVAQTSLTNKRLKTHNRLTCQIFYSRESISCWKRKLSLLHMRPLKVLNDSKLILNDQEGQKKPLIYNLFGIMKKSSIPQTIN